MAWTGKQGASVGGVVETLKGLIQGDEDAAHEYEQELLHLAAEVNQKLQEVGKVDRPAPSSHSGSSPAPKEEL
jgi:hypothetical protein